MVLPKDLSLMINIPKSVWDEQIPGTLFDLCLRKCREDPRIMCEGAVGEEKLRVPLPPQVAEPLLETGDQLDVFRYETALFFICQKDTGDPPGGIIERLVPPIAIPQDSIVLAIRSQRLVDLDIRHCGKVGHEVFEAINRHGDRLLSLNLGYVANAVINLNGPPPVLKTKQLRRFVCHGLIADHDQYTSLFSCLYELRHVDLAQCKNINSLAFLSHIAGNLRTLILHGTQLPRLDFAMFKNLRFLDISGARATHYLDPDKALAVVVENLPNLTCLDISKTNLAGTGRADGANKSGSGTDIVGLKSRVDRPLEFLGLYQTPHDACRRSHIPAVMVSGDSDEKQILVAGEAYLERPKLLKFVLSDIFDMLRAGTIKNIAKTLDIVLAAMSKHSCKEKIIVAGSNCLHRIVTRENGDSFPKLVIEHIYKALLNSMAFHDDSPRIIDVGCYTLCHLDVPKNIHLYERMVQVLLRVLDGENQDGRSIFNMGYRMRVSLLNTLAHQIDNKYRQIFAKADGVRIFLEVIKLRVEDGQNDDTLKMAWDFLWSITDELPENARMFIACGGLEQLLTCFQSFKDDHEVLHNMVGAVGNVAEVADMRPKLLDDRFMSVLRHILESPSSEMEIVCNSVELLAHLLSDGPTAWTLKNPDRRKILERLVEAVDGWDVTEDRNLIYRSLKPILRLASVAHTEEVCYWAVWALANLIFTNPDRYCCLLVEEGGVEILKELMKRPTRLPKMKAWASVILTTCTPAYEMLRENL